MEKIALGSDHGGFQLKEEIKKFLSGWKDLALVDYGTNSAESVDYPVYAEKTARAVASGQVNRGIIFCGTGIGVSIVANKIKGIRAANCFTPLMAELSRRHNNANILALGGRLLDVETAKEITRVWLTTPFDGERHQRRIEQISALEC